MIFCVGGPNSRHARIPVSILHHLVYRETVLWESAVSWSYIHCLVQVSVVKSQYCVHKCSVVILICMWKLSMVAFVVKTKLWTIWNRGGWPVPVTRPYHISWANNMHRIDVLLHKLPPKIIVILRLCSRIVLRPLMWSFHTIWTKY